MSEEMLAAHDESSSGLKGGEVIPVICPVSGG